jgi:hypothetical protein
MIFFQSSTMVIHFYRMRNLIGSTNPCPTWREESFGKFRFFDRLFVQFSIRVYSCINLSVEIFLQIWLTKMGWMFAILNRLTKWIPLREIITNIQKDYNFNQVYHANSGVFLSYQNFSSATNCSTSSKGIFWINTLTSPSKSQLAEYISQILLKYYIPTIEMLVK